MFSLAVTPEHCHTVTPGHYHTVTPGHYHTVTPGRCNTITPGHCHTARLEQCHRVTPGHNLTVAPVYSHTVEPENYHRVSPPSRLGDLEACMKSARTARVVRSLDLQFKDGRFELHCRWGVFLVWAISEPLTPDGLITVKKWRSAPVD